MARTVHSEAHAESKWTVSADSRLIVKGAENVIRDLGSILDVAWQLKSGLGQTAVRRIDFKMRVGNKRFTVKPHLLVVEANVWDDTEVCPNVKLWVSRHKLPKQERVMQSFRGTPFLSPELVIIFCYNHWL